MQLLGRLVRALVSLVVLAGVVGGLPLALLRWGHWPITGVPTLDQIENLPSTIVTDTSIFGILTVAAWVVWAAFVASLAVEIAAGLRGAVGRDLPLCGPLQRSVRPLVAALVMSVSSTGSLSSVAAGGMFLHARPAAAVVEEQPAPGPEVTEPAMPQAPSGDEAADGRTIVVRPDDTYWGIAERLLGNGLRWREVRDLNVGRTMPDGRTLDARSDLLVAGWVLLVPEDSAGSAQRGVGEALGPEVEVRPGDSMWRVAERHLTQVLGRHPDDGETAGYVTRLAEVNDDRLVDPSDPDLIYPGQDLLLPPVGDPSGATPTPATAEPEPQAAPEPAAGPAQHATPARPVPSAPPAPTTTTVPTVTSTPLDEATPAPTEPAVASTTVEAPSAPGTAGPRSSPPSSTSDQLAAQPDEDDAELPIAAAVAVASTALAVGVTAEIRRRRRRRNYLAPTRLPHPPPKETEEFHRELILAADEDSVDFLRAALGMLAEGLAESGQACAPLVVQHGPGYTDVLLDRPATPAAHGWKADHDGTIWSLDTSAVRVDGPLRWMSPAPLLVTLGRPSDEGQVYLDLEAAGLVTLTGDVTTRLDLLRTFAAEVAHSPFGEATSVVVVGELGMGALFDECEQVTVQYGWDAVIDELAQWTEESRETLTQRGCQSSFAARNSDPEDDSLVSLLVLATRPPESPDVLAFLHDGPATAAVVVAADDPLPGSVLVECSPEELWLSQLDLSCIPRTVDADRARQIAELLGAASDQGGTQLELTLDLGPTGDGSQGRQEPAVFYTDPAYDVLVRCLGDLAVEGVFKRRLRPKEVAAIAYIALNSPVSAEKLEDALWASPTTDTRRRRLVNVISQCRYAIGKRHLPRVADAHYTVGPDVKTDIDLFEARIHAAERQSDREAAVDLVLDALSLCTGPVFRTRWDDRDSFGWMEASNLLSHWEIKLTHVAQQLAEDCLEHGDTRRAIEACEAGLRAMNTHKGCTEALMRAHAIDGNLAVVQHVFQAHVTALELIQVDQVAASTIDLYERLMDPGPGE